MAKKVSIEVGSGVTFGMVSAAIISWSTWHSIPWAIAHGFCSWLYVGYWAITHM